MEEDGELDFPNKEMFSSSFIGDLPSCCSMDSLFNGIPNDAHACTHTHTCNPPGPDLSHTHTCVHVHTAILPSSSEDQVATDDTGDTGDNKSKKRPLGNREAVRKYREKKKAHAASLEGEVARLKALNQQLIKKLQGLPALEAENARLKCLLVDIRGRIEGEIGPFPYQNQAKGAGVYQNLGGYVVNPCNMQCNDQVYCHQPGVQGKNGEGTALDSQGFASCEFENTQCLGNTSSSSELMELPGCGIGNTASAVNSSGRNKKKGGARAAMTS